MGRSGIGAGRCGDFAGMVNGGVGPIEKSLDVGDLDVLTRRAIVGGLRASVAMTSCASQGRTTSISLNRRRDTNVSVLIHGQGERSAGMRTSGRLSEYDEHHAIELLLAFVIADGATSSFSTARLNPIMLRSTLYRTGWQRSRVTTAGRSLVERRKARDSGSGQCNGPYLIEVGETFVVFRDSIGRFYPSGMMATNALSIDAEFRTERGRRERTSFNMQTLVPSTGNDDSFLARLRSALLTN